MKKVSFIPVALAAAMFSACSSDNVTDENGGANGETVTRYLTVDLKNVGTAPGTRANGYEYGTENESKINSVRFYFFHSNGNAYKLADGTNFITKTVTDNNPSTDGDNIEHITKQTLVIDGENSAPASVIAVINPETLNNSGSLSLGNGAIDLNTLKRIYDNKFYNGTGSDATDFVMSNSVYLSAGTEVCATQVAGYVSNSEEEALDKPMDIYVERVAAKVTANVDTNSGWALGTGENWATTKYGKEVGKMTLANDAPVYAVIDGWGVTSENGRAELEKQISASWTSDALGITPWSTADYHRSFWCLSSAFNSGADANANHPVYHSLNAITGQFGDAPIYTLPNTMQTRPANIYNNNDLTKFIVATTLRYYNTATNAWENAEICEYRGISHLGTQSVLTEVANENNQYYYKTVAGGVATYTKLAPSDLTFSTTAPDGSTAASSIKSYEVVAKLADGHTTEIYEKTGSTGTDADYTAVTAADVNKKLATYTAQVRKDGRAYYYIPIKHLGDKDKIGEYGIVRNHWYQINLQNMQGFGTPVYNPDQEIVPELPSNDKTYLSARINVLSWRVVQQNVNLDATK